MKYSIHKYVIYYHQSIDTHNLYVCITLEIAIYSYIGAGRLFTESRHLAPPCFLRLRRMDALRKLRTVKHGRPRGGQTALFTGKLACFLEANNHNFDQWMIIVVIYHKKKQKTVNSCPQRSENMKKANGSATGDGRKQGLTSVWRLPHGNH